VSNHISVGVQADQNSAAAAMQDARARQRSALPDLYDESYVACDALPTERVPMSCADVVAQTRGKASSRPNKFILPVDFTSERPQRGGGNRIDYALTSRPKGAKAVRADPNDTICHLCEGDGALMVYRLYLCSMLQYQELSHMFFFLGCLAVV
jgi:hypothetical protein